MKFAKDSCLFRHFWNVKLPAMRTIRSVSNTVRKNSWKSVGRFWEVMERTWVSWTSRGTAPSTGQLGRDTPTSYSELSLALNLFTGRSYVLYYNGVICETASFIRRPRLYTDSHTHDHLHKCLKFHVHAVNLMGEPEQCSPPVWPSSQRVNDGKARATFTRYIKYVQSPCTILYICRL